MKPIIEEPKPFAKYSRLHSLQDQAATPRYLVGIWFLKVAIKYKLQFVKFNEI